MVKEDIWFSKRMAWFSKKVVAFLSIPSQPDPNSRELATFVPCKEHKVYFK